MNTIILDIIENSLDKPYIALSEKMCIRDRHVVQEQNIEQLRKKELMVETVVLGQTLLLVIQE